MLRSRPYSFPGDKGIRVIDDTDCFNECDDQFCVAHILMTPRFDVKAVISEQSGVVIPNPDSERQNYEEIRNIAELMGLRGELNILHGAKAALPDENTPVDSEGARFIVEEAMKDDPRPLFVCNQGAATNIASAYLMEPRIAKKLTVIWIGGGAYPEGGFEFNLCNDVNAARVLFKSDMELWQVPMNVYSTMKVSYFELLNNVYPCGAIGSYLVSRAMKFGKNAEKIGRSVCGRPGARAVYGEITPAVIATAFGGELWSLGDSPCVGLMLNSTLGRFHIAAAPAGLTDEGRYVWEGRKTREIRVYDDIDSRFIIQDMFEKLEFYFR